MVLVTLGAAGRVVNFTMSKSVTHKRAALSPAQRRGGFKRNLPCTNYGGPASRSILTALQKNADVGLLILVNAPSPPFVHRCAMSSSRSIAAMVGPVLLAVSASEALNLRIWLGVAAPVVYLNGCLLFVAGLSIVRAHNVWTFRWPVAVTLIGWLALAAGLYRMFFPRAPQGGENLPTYALIVVLFATGCLLTAMSRVTSDADG